jgi:hypothetical protein
MSWRLLTIVPVSIPGEKYGKDKELSGFCERRTSWGKQGSFIPVGAGTDPSVQGPFLTCSGFVIVLFCILLKGVIRT